MFPMLLFVISFLAIYAAMHVLVFWGVYPLLAGHPLLPTLTAGWMALMIVAPVTVRLLDRNGYQLPARALAWVGYSWMGFLFLAFALFLLFGLWHLFVLALGKLLPAATLLTIHRPAASALVLLAVLAAGLYGFLEAADLRVETVRLISSKLPDGVERLRIAQVSDLHLGLIHREEALAPIVARIEQLAPDLLVATGDIVDAQISHLEELSDLWNRLSPPLGKYAVTGNHEFYAGLDQSLDYLKRSGFTVLRNTAAAPADFLRIIGVDDPAGGGAPDELPLLEQADQKNFVLLLKHRPRIGPHCEGLFDLQLSGHAHGGQIFPFRLLTRLFYPLYDGLYRLAGGSVLYTSRGTGTWGPPMRILSPPEITLFEIVRHPQEANEHSSH
jgi:predicted MPP superfamily phosphohydrolase